MVKSQDCITSGSKTNNLEYYTINTYDNYSFCGIVGYWCMTSAKVNVISLYPAADGIRVCVTWQTVDGSTVTDNKIKVFVLYVYQSS